MDWGEDRVVYRNAEGHAVAVPTGWTDRAQPNLFVAVAAGRAMLTMDDFGALSRLVDALGSTRDSADV